MSVLGGSDSKTKQTVTNSQQTASDQGVNFRTGNNALFGTKISVGKQGTYAPNISYVTQGYTGEDLDRITQSFQQSLSATVTGAGKIQEGQGVAGAIQNRLATQITDAPADAARQKRNLFIIVGTGLLLAALALVLGRKT